MKFYRPLFTIIIILIQLSLSLMRHCKSIAEMEKLKKENPQLYEVIDITYTYDTLFLFVLIIGFYEMTTKTNLYKTLVRIFLICIVLGTQFSELVPIEDFYFGVYNIAWFSAMAAIVLILARIGKNVVNPNKLKKVSR